MQKLFDKILSAKIKKVFNNHREPYNPADWKKLKAHLTGKRRTPVIWLNIAKAASVVLFIGVSTLYVNRNDENLQSIYTIPNNQIDINSDKSVEKEGVYITRINNEEKEIYEDESEFVTDSVHYEIKNNIANQINEMESVKNMVSINRIDSIKIQEIIAYADSSRDDSLKQIVQIQAPEQDFEIDKKERNSKFDFAVAVTSMYSYSTQIAEGSINMGGGFTTSYKVSEKFSISSGMIIAHQSLDYANTRDMVFANEKVQYDANTTLVSDPASSKSRIEFVGIDIPLNIKYKIKRLIVSAGVSSIVFISEKRTYSTNALVLNTEFNSATNSYETNKTMENFQSEDKSPAFNRVDFASLLNISVGYEVPLRKGSILVEPFLKYPLGEISSANIKIGSGGLSLYYYF